MFAFSLNKLNPIKEGKPTKEIGHSKKKDCIVGLIYKGDHYEYCDQNCHCLCYLKNKFPLIKPSKSTLVKKNKQN